MGQHCPTLYYKEEIMFKKAITFILSIALAVCLVTPAFAATTDNTLTYNLSTNESNNITVNTNDVITVEYTITASARSATSTTQNQIIYDHNFFELVPGSINTEPDYSSVFTTSNPIESDGTHYIFYNSVSNVIFTAGTSAKIGTFQLKVKANAGSSVIRNTQFFATDKEAKLFAAESRDLTVTVNGDNAVLVTGISLNMNSTDLKSGETKQLVAAIAPSNAKNKTITWSSSNNAVAIVDASGAVTAKSEGTAVITATTVDGGKTASCTVTVAKGEANKAVTGISLNKATVTLKTGATEALTATVSPAGAANKAVNWSSSNASVATVDAAGVVTAKAEGAATITVTTADGGKTATCTVTVSKGDVFTVKATCGAGGTITPNGEQSVKKGENIAFTIKANEGYVIKDVKIDGVSNADAVANRSYTFSKVEKDHTIDVTFEKTGGGSTTNPFSDVKTGEYYYDAVLWAAENGITQGTGATTFSPAAPVTRAQVVTFLWRAAGSPEPKGIANKFGDISASAYYAKAVAWAIERGITKGTSDTTFSPNMVCTRGQIVTFLARFAGVQDATTQSVFSDVKSTDYFAAAVKWAKDNGVTSGTSAATFSPSADCTRGQIVTFLYRWMVR